MDSCKAIKVETTKEGSPSKIIGKEVGSCKTISKTTLVVDFFSRIIITNRIKIGINLMAAEVVAGEEAEGIKIKTEVDFRTIRIIIKTNQGSCRITSNLLSVMAGLRATRTNLKGSEVKVKDFSKTKLKGF